MIQQQYIDDIFLDITELLNARAENEGGKSIPAILFSYKHNASCIVLKNTDLLQRLKRYDGAVSTEDFYKEIKSYIEKLIFDIQQENGPTN